MIYLIAYFLIGFISTVMIRIIEGPMSILIWMSGILFPPGIIIVYIFSKLIDIEIEI